MVNNKIFIQYLKAVHATLSSNEFLKYKKAFTKFKKIIILGNGGSNSVASHISQDMAKFYKKASLSFSEPSMLTCFINDFGMSQAYVKFLKIYGDRYFLYILISSRGESENIINCVKYLEKNKMSYGVLTGFEEKNTIRKNAKKALFNFHVKSKNYGVVECTHQTFLHGVI